MAGEARTVGVIGARGHAGGELLAILARHPGVDVAFAGSRRRSGEAVPQVEGLAFESIGPDELAGRSVDGVFLALPDGLSQPFVAAVSPETVVVDISADHRLDDMWVYGLPEIRRDKIQGARRIANPGCYATAMHIVLQPFLDELAGVPAVFGVSGHSGAGTTPSPRNDPERLRDNLMPYRLTGHKHERETSHHLGRPVRFMPHVHPAFRGLLITAHIPLRTPLSRTTVMERLAHRYRGEQLVDLQEAVPELRDGTGRLGLLVGGVEVAEDPPSVVVVAAEDNLLKGAAVQAVQNLNLALGMPETRGIL